ncbi:MAG: ABC transporter permease subunit [Candidatus Lokiarchaeota archaeon]|nr:ABC transporter permease subunit [Candidatus Lokiarchaeota archaeon]
MSDLGGLIRKEFGRIRSDKRSLVLLFAIPIILIVVLGLTAGGTTTFFNASIISKDSIECSGEFPDNTSSEYAYSFMSIVKNNCTAFGLKTNYTATDESSFQNAKSECSNLLKSEVIDIYIILPENFSEVVEASKNGSINIYITYYIDGSDMTAVQAAEVALMEPLAFFRMQAGLLENMTQVIPYTEFDVPSWKTQILNYALPMMLPLIILGLDMNLTSLSIVSEGPLPRMLLTPTGRREIVLSKLISYSAVMFLQVTEVFTAIAIFDLYCLGSLFDFYLVLLVTGFCGVTMGLFISAISTTEQVANQIYLMMFIVLVMFSGFMPAELLPPWMGVFIDILPLGHSMELLSNIALKGLGIDEFHLSVVLGIAILFLAIAYIAYALKTKLKKLEV